MSTRGALGFYKNGNTKATYNHSDSYPSYLGVHLLKELRGFSIEKLNDAFKNIIMVNEDDVPTDADIKQYSKYANEGVSTGKKTEWYVLLRASQGSLKPYISGEIQHMIDGADFLKDSLFCEWAYIVNLDTNKFEVWKGFNTTRHPSRYEIAEPQEDKYFAVKLLKSYSLKNLPKDMDFLVDVSGEYKKVGNKIYKGFQEFGIKINEKYGHNAFYVKTEKTHMERTIILLKKLKVPYIITKAKEYAKIWIPNDVKLDYYKLKSKIEGE